MGFDEIEFDKLIIIQFWSAIFYIGDSFDFNTTQIRDETVLETLGPQVVLETGP